MDPDPLSKVDDSELIEVHNLQGVKDGDTMRKAKILKLLEEKHLRKDCFSLRKEYDDQALKSHWRADFPDGDGFQFM